MHILRLKLLHMQRQHMAVVDMILCWWNHTHNYQYPFSISETKTKFLIETNQQQHGDYTSVSHTVYMYMWQSLIEIEYYLSCILSASPSLIDALWHWVSAKGRAQYLLCKRMNIWCIYEACMSPAPSGSLALQCARNMRRNNIRFLFRTATYI